VWFLSVLVMRNSRVVMMLWVMLVNNVFCRFCGVLDVILSVMKFMCVIEE